MIVVFGSISVDMPLSIKRFPDDDTAAVPAECLQISAGGKAACQALAATRSGVKTALVGKVGDDEFSTTILNKLRREGVVTSGVAKSDHPTGIDLVIKDELEHTKNFHVTGANAETTADQVPEEVLGENSFLLLQTEINAIENTKLLSKAKKQGATTIMNLAPSIELSQQTLDDLDYLIVNQEEAKQLSEKLGIKVENDALKLAEGLSKQGSLNCLITIGARGSVAFTTEGQGWSVEALPVEKIIDRSGAEDAYSGTLAAWLQTGMSLPRAMKRASIAASLTCTKSGRISAFPYLDDIDQRINDIKDPVQA